MKDPKHFNDICTDKLPGLLGIVVTQVNQEAVRAEIEVTQSHMAPNGFLHAGTVVTLAAVAYSHLTLPTICSGSISVGAVSLEKKNVGNGNGERVASGSKETSCTHAWY